MIIQGTRLGAFAGANGQYEIWGIEQGTVSLRVSLVGYAPLDTSVLIISDDSLLLDFSLHPEHVEAEAVVVTGTRTIRNIEDVPVRVEAIPQEEVEEKLLMTPSSVAMLLNESTGMRVQTTSATSNAANLRIQGLGGRYTQLLVDGVPAFGGLSAGFGLTQLLPLNLRQVEVIKGATSALYGADAIAGVVNFLTKEPKAEPELSALLNGTTQRGIDAAAFYSRPLEPFGFTAFVSGNRQPLVDVDNDGYADVAAFERISGASKLYYGTQNELQVRLGIGWLSENRHGGSVHPGSSGGYTEEIKTRRLDLSTQLDWHVSQDAFFLLKVAGAQLERDARYGLVPFRGTQRFFSADAQYSVLLERHTLLFGGAAGLDEFDDRTPDLPAQRDYHFVTPGLFIQDEFAFADRWTLLASVRLDRHSEFGTFLTPRFSLMYRPTPLLTLRVGGGSGFKAPTIFVEEAEENGLENVRPLGNVRAETAKSLSFDVNYRTVLGEATAALNTALFLTNLEASLIADDDSLAADVVFLRNAFGPLLSRGGEMSAKFTYGNFKLSIGYTYLFATQEDRGIRAETALNPRHSAGGVLVWESEEHQAKAGVEVYWTGRQRVERNPYRTLSPAYWITGVIAEKGFGHLRVFINFENIFDTRQTRFEPIAIGSAQSGGIITLPIYAPLEGRVVNGGLRYVL